MLRRKLIKNHASYQVNLPKDYIKNLQWQRGDELFIKQVGNNIMLSNNLKKKRQVL